MTSYLYSIASKLSPFRSPTSNPEDATVMQTVTPQDLHHESSFDDDQELAALREALEQATIAINLRTATKAKLAKAPATPTVETPARAAPLTVDPVIHSDTDAADRNGGHCFSPSEISQSESPVPSPFDHRDDLTPARGQNLFDSYADLSPSAPSRPSSVEMHLPEALSRQSVDNLLAGEYQRHANFSEFDAEMVPGEKPFKKLYDEGSKKLRLPSPFKGDASQLSVFTKALKDRCDLQRFGTVVTIPKGDKTYNLITGWIHLTVEDVRNHQANLISKYHADPVTINQRPLIDMAMMYTMLQGSLSASMIARMTPYEDEISRNGPVLFRRVMAESHLESYDQLSHQVFEFLQPKELNSYNDISHFHTQFNAEHEQLLLLSSDRKHLLTVRLLLHTLVKTYQTCPCAYFIQNSLPAIERMVHLDDPSIFTLQKAVEKEVARLQAAEHWHVPPRKPPGKEHHGREKHGRERNGRAKHVGLTALGGRTTPAWIYEKAMDSKNKSQYKGKTWCNGLNKGKEMHKACWTAHAPGTCMSHDDFMISIGKSPRGGGRPQPPPAGDKKSQTDSDRVLHQARALLANYDPNMDDEIPVQLLQLLKG